MQTLSNSWLPRKPKFWQFSITQKHINFITAKSLATVSWWEINVKDEQGKTSTTLKERYLAELYRSNTKHEQPSN
jgi:PIN domain nuclease of toxin-antitoxin system